MSSGSYRGGKYRLKHKNRLNFETLECDIYLRNNNRFCQIPHAWPIFSFNFRLTKRQNVQPNNHKNFVLKMRCRIIMAFLL